MFCNIYKTFHCRLLRLAIRKAHTKSGKKYQSHNIRLNEYLHEINAVNLKNFLPRNLLKFAKANEHLYLIDDYLAGHISETIVNNLCDRTLVVETNPGLGILTKRLLENDVQCINLYESNPHFFPHLYALRDNYEKNIVLFEQNLIETMKLKFKDRMDNGTREEEIVQTFPKRRWVEDPPVPIVATLTSTMFIKYLMLSLFMQNGLMIHCRPELYLIVPRLIYNVLMGESRSSHHALSLTFQMAFQVTLLTKVSRESFLPWMQKSKSALKKGEDPNFQEMYLIQATARPDFYETVVSPEKIRELWYFVSICFTSPNTFVIPSLEKYIPNCGPRLIFNNNFNIYTRFSDLSVEQVLSMFTQFTSWPEYSSSVFNDCIHTLFMKSNIIFEELEKLTDQEDKQNNGENKPNVIKGSLRVNN